MAFLALTGILMVAILPGVFWELHRAKGAFNDFSHALVSKDYPQAYSLTAPELHATTNYEAFVKIHDELNAKQGDLRRVDVDQAEVKDRADGWYATVDTHMVFAHGSLPFIFILKKEAGDWKIYSYHEQ